MELEVDGVTVSLSGFVDRVDGWSDKGRLYLRVVDYKTGRKSFDLTDVWNGLGLQMLIYLFTLKEKGKEKFGADTIVPAGVLYFPARDAVEGQHKVIRQKPFPVQKPQHVAKAMVKGLERGRKYVNPCKLFSFAMVLFALFPFVRTVYWKLEKKKLDNFEAQK